MVILLVSILPYYSYVLVNSDQNVGDKSGGREKSTIACMPSSSDSGAAVSRSDPCVCSGPGGLLEKR